eukprot:m.83182 g.83182  ORF g.83182 m.83182 type:complete len:266 (+) comp36334_c0_seq23:135-932(+)
MLAKKTVLFFVLYFSTVMLGVSFWMTDLLSRRRPISPCSPSETKKSRLPTVPPVSEVKYKDNHQLAVVVPIRDRFEEFLEFVPHIHRFLNAQRVRHQIWIINQFDNHRFNRASLLNVGFLLSTRRGCDYIAMHDVDLLPLNPALDYSYPEKGPFHVSAPNLHPKYHYKTFVGGILMLTADQFEKCNGLSNLFWGWGREDDEFYRRMIEAGYQVSRTRDRQTGLHSVEYEVVEMVNVTIKEAPCTVVNVKLSCNKERTPFCDKPAK